MIRISAKADIPDLRGLATGAVLRALRKAGSTAQRDMRAQARKQISQRKRLKRRAVTEALRLRTRGRSVDTISWSLDVADTAARVSDYPHRQTKRGVSVEINRGQRTMLAGAFKATMKSGHKGVFERVERGVQMAGAVSLGAVPASGGRRVGRLPIRERLASRVLDAMSHQGEAAAVLERGQKSFADTFVRVLPLELAKEKI